jgi:hypothetical protein
MKKEVKNGQGFNCKDLNERNKIWKKLEDAGYTMFHKRSTIGIHSYLEYLNIVWKDDYFCFCKNAVSTPLNESEFFGESEWTPKPGEWVEVSDDGKKWYRRQFFCTIDKLHLTASGEYSHSQTSTFTEWQHIRQIKPKTMTLKEAQEKLRELLNKPNLIIEP